MFTQSPCAHGFLSHSSSSGKKTKKKSSDTFTGLMCLQLSTHKKTELTKALSSSIQPVSHVALAAISDPSRHGDTPAIQTEVAVGLAHVGDVLYKVTCAE